MKNEPAYPIVETNSHNSISPGLTKREYFAGLAMQGLISDGERYMNYVDEYQKRATQAVKYADALLEALNESK